MPFRFYFFFIFFSLFFLFYPGNSPYYNIFAYNRGLFADYMEPISPEIHSVPYVKSNLPPDIMAEGVYVADLPSFTPVYEKNAKMKLYPASTTKIITSLVAYDMYKPEDIITVKQASIEGQIMELQPGERITAENLLYGLLVHSANDAAFAFANDIGKEKFMQYMNEKARTLGMYDSHFTNPAGLDENSQLTTPFDLAIAARALLRNPYLSKIVATKEITISDSDFKIFHKLTNVNKLLGEIPGLGGLKTGYTELAGENLVSFYKNGDHDFVIIIMKSQDRFEDTKKIIQWIKEQVDYVKVDKTRI